jgi:aminoglycoside 6-adenylyltransferase
MKNKTDVMDLVLRFASGHPLVRAVIQNGSRVNPRLTPDEFADYDVVFVVENPEDFKDDRSWIRRFGETLIMQQNDSDQPGVNWVIFLMLFTDGVRIDLTFFPKSHARLLYEDSLKKLLIDKDGLFPGFPEPDDSFYFTRRPSEGGFYRAVNNFWWCLTNVAKGIARDELCYVKSMHDLVVREEMNRLIHVFYFQSPWTMRPTSTINW